jgi:hypothetical protein
MAAYLLNVIDTILAFTDYMNYSKYGEISQLNALNYILLYFSFMMAPTCFSKTMPSSGSDYIPF